VAWLDKWRNNNSYPRLLPSIFESQIRKFRGDALKNGKILNQTIILVSLYYLFIYLFIYLTIYITPSILDESIAVLDIDRFLLPKEEWLESFILNVIVKDIIREILEYIPIDIPSKKGGPKNID
jgi:hypothetical protein